MTDKRKAKNGSDGQTVDRRNFLKTLGAGAGVTTMAAAGGVIGSKHVADQAPDGRTFLAVASAFGVRAAIDRTVPYEVGKDLVGVGQMARSPSFMVVSTQHGFKSLQDLIAYAKKQPQGIHYSSAGVGSTAHLHAAATAHLAGIKAEHVPQRGTPEALALAERLQGVQGVAWMALVIALCVPLCNVAAVWPLARHGGHAYGRELVRNPLIVATVAGLLANLIGVRLPAPVDTTLQRLGLAALPLGLMAVGAGLRFGGLRESPGLAGTLLAIRHVALPIFALALSSALNLSAAQRTIVIAFAALPTAPSAYVLALRMGGNGAYVAAIVTLSTLLGMLSLPSWLAVLSLLP